MSVGSSKSSLGETLQTQRKARGFTLSDLAARAGVNKSTISRWERSKTVPFADELTRVLDALALSQAERHCYYRSLEAPRAVHLAGAGVSADLPVSSGELLRALRLRAEVSRRVIARAADVAQNLVVQWERGECWPNPQHLHAFCFAVGATEDEIVFLTTRAWRHLDPLPLDKDALDDVVWRLDMYDTSATRAGTYLALAGRYQALFRAGKISEAEATAVYGSYGYYLVWRLGHYEEAQRVAAPAFAALKRSRGILTRGQVDAINLMVLHGDEFGDRVGGNSAGSAGNSDMPGYVDDALALLSATADRLPPRLTPWHTGLMGRVWEKVGNPDAALPHLERAITLAQTEMEAGLRRIECVTSLHKHGRFRQAVRFLAPSASEEPRVFAHVNNLMYHARVFAGLRDFAQAERYLSEGATLARQAGLTHCEAIITEVAHTIETGKSKRK